MAAVGAFGRIVALQPEAGRIALTEPFDQAEPRSMRMPGHHNLIEAEELTSPRESVLKTD